MPVSPDVRESSQRPIVARGLSLLSATGSHLVDNVDLSVETAEVVAIVGEYGSGKTALLEILMGLTKPTSGHALIMGRDSAIAPTDAKRDVTYVSRHAKLFSPLTLGQNMAMFAALDNPTRRRQPAEFADSIRRVGIPDRAFLEPVTNLPRRLVIAAWLAVALMRDTPIVILDEPSEGMRAQDCRDLFLSLEHLRQSNKAILIATADVYFAAQIASRIVVMNAGKCIAERTGPDVLGLSAAKLYVDLAGRAPRRPVAPARSPVS